MRVSTWALLGLWLCAVACASPGAPADGPREVSMKLEPPAPRHYVRGPALTPTPALAAALDALAQEPSARLVRAPVVLTRGPMGFSLRDARLGGAADALALHCDDSALGVGLADRARHACGDAPTCTLWLEGRVGPAADGGRTFLVRFVGDALDAQALAAITHLEIEESAAAR